MQPALLLVQPALLLVQPALLMYILDFVFSSRRSGDGRSYVVIGNLLIMITLSARLITQRHVINLLVEVCCWVAHITTMHEKVVFRH